MKTNLIKCKFKDENGRTKGREYAYNCNFDVSVGDDVIVLNTQGLETEVVVIEINVPLETVEKFKDKVKSVIKMAQPKVENNNVAVVHGEL